MVLSRNWLIVGILSVIVIGGYWYLEQRAVAPLVVEQTPRSYFEPLLPLRLGTEDVFVSIADTPATRTLGLSRTTTLPNDVVKLFVFETPGVYSFWMKDMNYPIDMIWLDTEGTILHIEEAVPPESYPQIYGPDVPAKYVLETNAGYFKTTGLRIGDIITLSNSTN